MWDSDYQDARPKGWKFLYRAAIFETNTFKKLRRISDAEQAIVQQMHELFHETGPGVAEEREAMDDAIYAFESVENRAGDESSCGSCRMTKRWDTRGGRLYSAAGFEAER